jgi:hypothetical protein
MKNRIRIVLFSVALIGLILSTSCASSKIPTINANSLSTSANGLSLSLSLSKTTYQPGQEVSLTVDVKNTWSKTNHVTLSNDWPYNNLASGQCDLGSPYGIAIFQGNYTSSDFSTAMPIALWDYNFVVPCPISIPISSYVFKPLSDIATAFSSNASFPNSTYAINAEFTETGYWTGNAPNATLTDFQPGVYTVVAGDEWGALVVLHFTVS